MCPRSSNPIYILYVQEVVRVTNLNCKLLYKMGHYFLDKQYHGYYGQIGSKIMNFPFEKHFKEQFNSSLSFVNKPISLSIFNPHDTHNILMCFDDRWF